MTDEPPRKGLGRGLSALLAEDPDDQSTLDRMRSARTVPVENLRPNRYQPRQRFDNEALKTLTQSVRENGILMPILVRRVEDDGDTYEIIAGERRWRAAQEAQLYEVPIVIKDLDDNKALEVALIENVQREDLTPIEEAEGYRRLMHDFARTQEDVARSAGKSRPHVANMLRLLSLPEGVREMLHDGRLSAGHGRALAGSEAPEALAEKIVRQGLNVRQAEALAKKSQETAKIEALPGSPTPDADTKAVEHQLSEKLGLVVKIKHRGERGEVRITFNTLEQFDEILARLNQTPRH